MCYVTIDWLFNETATTNTGVTSSECVANTASNTNIHRKSNCNNYYNPTLSKNNQIILTKF